MLHTRLFVWFKRTCVDLHIGTILRWLGNQWLCCHRFLHIGNPTLYTLPSQDNQDNQDTTSWLASTHPICIHIYICVCLWLFVCFICTVASATHVALKNIEKNITSLGRFQPLIIWTTFHLVVSRTCCWLRQHPNRLSVHMGHMHRSSTFDVHVFLGIAESRFNMF